MRPRWLLPALLIAASLTGVGTPGAQEGAGRTAGSGSVHRIVITGGINPAVAEFIERAIETAHEEGSEALILEHAAVVAVARRDQHQVVSRQYRATSVELAKEVFVPRPRGAGNTVCGHGEPGLLS